ncbi:MAG TPA: hypothetical protein VND02_07105 [Actinomycetota bacterium]|nr:hypothetical protein [Actinomycetota bacterium]
MPASTELSEAVLGQRRLLERLLVHRRRDTGEEPSLRSPDAGDAEFVKNLQIFLRLVVDADALYLRAAHNLTGDPGQAAAVTGRVEELRARITLPTDVPLTLELLLGRRFELERLLIELGDRTYLAGRLADLYDEQPGTFSTWRSLYGDELPPLLPGGVTGRPETVPPPGPEEVEATRERLARLMHAKESQAQVAKARWAIKQRVTALTILVLLLAVAAFGVAVAGMVADDRALWSAAAAGAAGAALGGLIRLRDEVTLGTQVRQFWLFFCGQVLVGVAAGVLTFLIDDGGLVAVAGGSAGVAAVAFAVGFSEAAFVGLLARLGGSVAGG